MAGLKVNVGNVERWLSIVGGALLLARQWAKKPKIEGLFDVIKTGEGLALLQRGLTGFDPMYHALDVSTVSPGSYCQEVRKPFLKGLIGIRDVYIRRSITVNRAPEMLFHFWRNLENWPRFMSGLDSISPLELKGEAPHELIYWESVKGAPVRNAGAVHFIKAPGNWGTEVQVIVHFRLSRARFARVLDFQLRDSLRRFRRLLETGEERVA